MCLFGQTYGEQFQSNFSSATLLFLWLKSLLVILAPEGVQTEGEPKLVLSVHNLGRHVQQRSEKNWAAWRKRDIYLMAYASFSWQHICRAKEIRKPLSRFYFTFCLSSVGLQISGKFQRWKLSIRINRNKPWIWKTDFLILNVAGENIFKYYPNSKKSYVCVISQSHVLSTLLTEVALRPHPYMHCRSSITCTDNF